MSICHTKRVYYYNLMNILKLSIPIIMLNSSFTLQCTNNINSKNCNNNKNDSISINDLNDSNINHNLSNNTFTNNIENKAEKNLIYNSDNNRNNNKMNSSNNSNNNKNTFILTKIWEAKEVPEGDGATVRRAIGISASENMDPFLMMDHFNVRLPGGFPDHPHRGFETVTYMFQGNFYHEDFKGHKGKIGPGDVQWMTAGKGIMHAEIPASREEYSNGIQLWINLNKENKMCEPKYQEFTADTIPKIPLDDKNKEDTKSYIKVVSGEFNGISGPVKSITSVHYYDVYLEANKKVSIKVNKGKVNCFIYVHRGNSINVLGKEIKLHQASKVMKNSDEEEYLEFSTGNNKEVTGFLVMLGHPLEEPVKQYGPFVMNNSQQIEQTFMDYQMGKNGFEGASEWESEIKDLKYKK